MPTQKPKSKKSRSPRRRRRIATGRIPIAPSTPPFEVAVPKPTTEVVTEKTYVTIEPEVEVRQPATQAEIEDL
jgi:hypothetical protein